MSEKRRMKRRKMILNLAVMDTDLGLAIGHLADISTEGILLLSKEPPDLNTAYHLRIVLPEEMLGRTVFDFDARSVWRKRDINPDYFITGFQMLDTRPRDVDMIVCLITQYGFPG